MRVVMIVLGLTLLAGCGADGEPAKPEPRIGANVSVGPSGVRVNTTAGVRVGNVTVNAGF